MQKFIGALMFIIGLAAAVAMMLKVVGDELWIFPFIAYTAMVGIMAGPVVFAIKINRKPKNQQD